MSYKKVMVFVGFFTTLVALALFSTECLAFAKPIEDKAVEATGHLLTIIRVLVVLVGAALLLMALSGRVNWKWVGVVCCVAVLSGPGWVPIQTFLGVGGENVGDQILNQLPNFGGRR